VGSELQNLRKIAAIPNFSRIRMKKKLSCYKRDGVSIFGATDEACPNVKRLEYILLSAHQNRRLFEKFQQHFLVCEACQRRIRLIELFYVILDEEIRQPLSPAVVEMAQRLAEPLRA
jgi:hypothetical protein